MEDRTYPVTLKVEIDHQGLKKLVEQGRLMEFVTVFPSLASQHIRAQVVDHVAKAAVGATQANQNVSISVGFDIDDDFGTPPHKHWPWWRFELGEALEQVLSEAITQKTIGLK
ncbi:MAG TPA: hypothetical protein VN426_06320 [Syntrophomonadaceae bacterium]|nr:hypothetical protein [Syntrophomonadaceae bacterium]